eukprot:731126-Amorphochlora_amoeboformis.AAC.2
MEPNYVVRGFRSDTNHVYYEYWGCQTTKKTNFAHNQEKAGGRGGKGWKTLKPYIYRGRLLSHGPGPLARHF